jgi:hypothetical protein
MMARSSSRIALLLGLVAFALTPAERAFACGDYPVFSVKTEEGGEIGLYLPEGQVAKTPEWEPGQGEPPLPLTAAIEAALRWAKTKYAKFDSVGIRDVELRRTGCGSEKRWYYIFNFSVYLDGSALLGWGSFAGVLMDGTVVEPRRQSTAN